MRILLSRSTMRSSNSGRADNVARVNPIAGEGQTGLEVDPTDHQPADRPRRPRRVVLLKKNQHCSVKCQERLGRLLARLWWYTVTSPLYQTCQPACLIRSAQSRSS